MSHSALKEDPIFTSVTVYDSLRKTSRRGEQGQLNPHTQVAKFLRTLQQFFALHCCVDDENKQFFEMLMKQPDLILRHATVSSCPQQENGYDCALFAFGVLIHLALNISVTETTFVQQDITKFRTELHQRLSNGTRQEPALPPATFFSQCFPKLTYEVGEPTLNIQPNDGQTDDDMDEDGDEMDEDYEEESARNNAAAPEDEVQDEGSTATTEDKEGAPASNEDVDFL
jgi:Ulp1 protease family, C-terminal catalytic domain